MQAYSTLTTRSQDDRCETPESEMGEDHATSIRVGRRANPHECHELRKRTDLPKEHHVKDQSVVKIRAQQEISEILDRHATRHHSSWAGYYYILWCRGAWCVRP